MLNGYSAVVWIIVIGFALTTIITLCGIAGFIKVKDVYLRRLFVALVLEIVSTCFMIFGRGSSPEQEYFREAKALMDEAAVASENGDKELADRKLGEILRLSVQGLPFDVRQVFRQRGMLFAAQKEWEPASRAFSVYYEIQQNDLDALILYGRSLRETNRYNIASEVYSQAEKLSGNNYEILNGLQNVNRRMGAFFLDADRQDVADSYFEHTRDYVTRMLALVPDKNKDPKRYQNAIIARARLYWEWRRYPEAITAYENAIAEFPSDIAMQEDFAAVLLEAGERLNSNDQISRARDSYYKLITSKPSGVDLVFDGAGFAEAAALAPDTTQDMLIQARTRVLTSLSELTKAEEDPYPFYAAALLFKRIGDNSQARQYLTSAIRYERRRAGNPYKFDYIRLVKYERLAQLWDAQSATQNIPTIK